MIQPSAIRHPQPRSWRQALTVACLIAVIGPPLGLALFLFVAQTDIGLIALGQIRQPSGGDQTSIGQALVGGAMLSYLLGGVPAICSAVWFGVATWRGGTFSYLHSALVAAAMSLMLVPLLFGWSVPSSGLSLLALVMAVTVAAALLLRALFGAIGLVR